jgi:hypothetical protein
MEEESTSTLRRELEMTTRPEEIDHQISAQYMLSNEAQFDPSEDPPNYHID